MKDEEFERLLKITRLKLTSGERSRIKADIEEVISYFDKIDRIDSKEAPAYQPVEIPTRFRKDEVIPFKNIDALKKPSRLHDGYILGPKL